jgi:hypothetical protein
MSYESDIWDDLVRSHIAYVSAGIKRNAAAHRFLSEPIDRIGSIRTALEKGDLDTVFYIAPHLTLEERTELFPTWVDWAAASPTFTEAVQSIILSLPHDWVLAHIEDVAEPLLQSDDDRYDYAYDLLLALYMKIDQRLARGLAERASEHPLPIIQHIGQQYVKEIAGN